MATAKSIGLAPGVEGALGKLTTRIDELRKAIAAEKRPSRREQMVSEYNAALVTKSRLQRSADFKAPDPRVVGAVDVPATRGQGTNRPVPSDIHEGSVIPPDKYESLGGTTLAQKQALKLRELRELVAHEQKRRASLGIAEKEIPQIEAMVAGNKVTDPIRTFDRYFALLGQRTKLQSGQLPPGGVLTEGPAHSEPAMTPLAAETASLKAATVMGVPVHAAVADPAELKAVEDEIAGLEKNGIHSGTDGGLDPRLRDRYNELQARRSRLRGGVPPGKALAGTIADAHHRPANGDPRIPDVK